MITVGRGRNNDIIVPDALVSKLHAVFRASGDGQWSLSDAGSSNGTKVGETALAPKGAPGNVRSGDEVTFGVQSFRFLSATALWVALRR
jgi:pSer/pThr/pTyr-binding forkhead associated (FHA) protein